MNRNRQHPFPLTFLELLALAILAVALLLLAGRGDAQVQPADEPVTDGAVRPAYDEEGRLLLPEDYRRWVFAGSSLGLSYSEGGGGMEMFHHTLMEPTAYDHFTRTGEFRDGTMLVLLLHGQGEGVLPQRRGRFAADVHGLEMAVKDSRRFEDAWAYYGFGGRDGLRDRAEAFDRGACYSCHEQHAAHDNVFVQFYPLLRDAAPAGSAVRKASFSPAAEGEAIDAFRERPDDSLRPPERQ